MRLIIFCGMMKSGNHAIIKWVFENALRNVLPETVIQSKRIGYNENIKVGNKLAFYNDITRNPPPPNYMTPCEITFVSLEDEYVEIDKLPHFKNVEWDSVHTVFIFRDLKNMIASRKLAKEYSEFYFGNVETMCQIWKRMCDDYERVKNKTNVYSMNYDELVKNGDSNLIEQLDLKRFLRFDQIPRIQSRDHKPGWSSFSDDKFTERHKQLNDNDLQIIDDFLMNF